MLVGVDYCRRLSCLPGFRHSCVRLSSCRGDSQAMAVFDDVEPWERKLAVYRHAVWQDSGQWAFTANEPSYVAVGEGMPLTRELAHFMHCIETRAEPRTDGEEAIRVLRILTAGTVTHSGSPA